MPHAFGADRLAAARDVTALTSHLRAPVPGGKQIATVRGGSLTPVGEAEGRQAGFPQAVNIGRAGVMEPGAGWRGGAGGV